MTVLAAFLVAVDLVVVALFLAGAAGPGEIRGVVAIFAVPLVVVVVRDLALVRAAMSDDKESRTLDPNTWGRVYKVEENEKRGPSPVPILGGVGGDGSADGNGDVAVLRGDFPVTLASDFSVALVLVAAAAGAVSFFRFLVAVISLSSFFFLRVIVYLRFGRGSVFLKLLMGVFVSVVVGGTAACCLR